MRAFILELTIFIAGAWLDYCLFVLRLRVITYVVSKMPLVTIFRLIGSVFISAKKCWFPRCFEVVLRNAIYSVQIITCLEKLRSHSDSVWETVDDIFSPKQICSTRAVQGWEVLRVQHSD